MRVGDVINFLEGVKAQEGDIRIESITGCWVHTEPRTGENIVVFAVGDGKPLEEALRGVG